MKKLISILLMAAMLLTSTLSMSSCGLLELGALGLFGLWYMDNMEDASSQSAAEDLTTTEKTDAADTGDPTDETTTEPEETTTEPPVIENEPDGTLPFVPSNPERIDYDWKAMWLSQFDLMQAMTAGSRQRTERQFRTRLSAMLDNVKEDGYNTVIVQVRPYADSMYPSAICPPSRYAVGAYGEEFDYDPFAIIIEMCRERELKVHAWINPMRGMSTSEIEDVPDNYQIKQWYNDSELCDKYLSEVAGYWYLDIAYPEVRGLIVDGVHEIMENYDVDGIHLDDYFYPTTDAAFDEQAYAESGGGMSLGDWRRANMNQLISELYAATKSHSLRALFGISPAGNLNTVFNNQYADVYTWCSTPGYIDYICPQVYYGFDHSLLPFRNTCREWQSCIKTDYVSLIIGVTFGKIGLEDGYAGAGVSEWVDNSDVMVRQLQFTETLNKCAGISVFCYQHIFDTSSHSRIGGKVGVENEQFTAHLAEATFKYVKR